MHQEENIEVFVDNQTALAISHNLVFHERIKHFKVKYYFLREVQISDEVRLYWSFETLRDKLGVCIAQNSGGEC